MRRCRSLEADLRCADVEASKVLATSRVSAKVTRLAAKVGNVGAVSVENQLSQNPYRLPN
jgi:hypothetical protein